MGISGSWEFHPPNLGCHGEGKDKGTLLKRGPSERTLSQGQSAGRRAGFRPSRIGRGSPQDRRQLLFTKKKASTKKRGLKPLASFLRGSWNTPQAAERSREKGRVTLTRRLKEQLSKLNVPGKTPARRHFARATSVDISCWEVRRKERTRVREGGSWDS